VLVCLLVCLDLCVFLASRAVPPACCILVPRFVKRFIFWSSCAPFIIPTSWCFTLWSRLGADVGGFKNGFVDSCAKYDRGKLCPSVFGVLAPLAMLLRFVTSPVPGDWKST
jgi:hypothetical protein